MSRKHFLYRHYNENGMLLYVGISLNYLNRTQEHKNNSDWFQEIKNITLEEHPTRQEAIQAEKDAIRNEEPLYNAYRPPPKKEDTLEQSESAHNKTRKRLLRRVVHVDPLYNLTDVGNVLGVSAQKVKQLVKDKELGCVIWRVTWHGASNKWVTQRKVTGWQLIDYLEYLEDQSKEQ